MSGPTNFTPATDCGREDCRIEAGMTTTTLLGWTPVFDKHGRPINHDPNTRTTAMRCQSCGRKWNAVSKCAEG